jgi:hypothetical protein
MLIVLPKRRILLLVPAWINANMTTGFLTALFPIAVVGLYSYWLTTLMLTWWQVYIVVAVSSHAPFRNMTVVGSRWSFLPDPISWLLTLTWMTSISYSLPTPVKRSSPAAPLVTTRVRRSRSPTQLWCRAIRQLQLIGSGTSVALLWCCNCHTQPSFIVFISTKNTYLG